MKISKELVSTVLGIEISEVHIVNNIINYIVPNYETSEDNEIVYIDLGQNINIYEFAHKCKEYCCFNFGIKLYSEVRKGDSRCSILKHRDGELINKQLTGKNEPEAIFKATEYVIKNKEQNGKN